VPTVVLDHVGTGVPERVEVAQTTIDELNFLDVAAQVALGVGRVEQRNRVQGLMDVSKQMNHVSRKKSTLCRVAVHLLTESLGGGGHDLKRTDCAFGVVEHWDHSVVDVGTVLEVPGVEEIHAILFALDIIGPGSRLDEGAAAVIAHLIDGPYQISEVNRGVGV
jgi:hypothetical protein